MKHRLLWMILLSMTLAASTAFAQADPGDLGVFFDPLGTQSVASYPGSMVFNMYVVAFDTPGNIFAYEGSITYDHVSMILLSAIFSGPGPINIGSSENWIVGAGGCIPGAGPVVLVSFQFFLLVPVVDSLVCLGPSVPSSFLPPTPGYLDCANVLLPFGVAQNGMPYYPNGCAVINPTAPPPGPIAVEQESWGAVKARF